MIKTIFFCITIFCITILYSVAQAQTELLPEPEPTIPDGFSDEITEQRYAQETRPEWNKLTGFFEIRGGIRTQKDPLEDDFSIGETRLQTEYEVLQDGIKLKWRGDLLYDPVYGKHDVNLKDGTGFLDIRELSIHSNISSFMDITLGRQVLAWGTGDKLYINDLFPKDWQSYYIGRDEHYINAPTDVLKVSFMSFIAGLDVVYAPRFDSNRFPNGERLSRYNPILGTQVGKDNIFEVDKPKTWFKDHEWMTRIFSTFSDLELALYGYRGFWKDPSGYDVYKKGTFPLLSVYGLSAKTPVYKGMMNVEYGYYHSRNDRIGNNPSVANSQSRFLLGYEYKLSGTYDETKLEVQYYMEIIQDYKQYKLHLQRGQKAEDQGRHVMTFRVDQKRMERNLLLSLMLFISPTDADAYIRPLIEYKIDEHWTATGGANLLMGNDNYTHFGQFERNSNVYVGLRYDF